MSASVMINAAPLGLKKRVQSDQVLEQRGAEGDGCGCGDYSNGAYAPTLTLPIKGEGILFSFPPCGGRLGWGCSISVPQNVVPSGPYTIEVEVHWALNYNRLVRYHPCRYRHVGTGISVHVHGETGVCGNRVVGGDGGSSPFGVVGYGEVSGRSQEVDNDVCEILRVLEHEPVPPAFEIHKPGPRYLLHHIV